MTDCLKSTAVIHVSDISPKCACSGKAELLAGNWFSLVLVLVFDRHGLSTLAVVYSFRLYPVV